MIDNEWSELPFPFTETAQPLPPAPLDASNLVGRMLEDATGLAGVIAVAAEQPETDARDVFFAARLLAEWLKATVTYYHRWQAQEEGEK